MAIQKIAVLGAGQMGNGIAQSPSRSNLQMARNGEADHALVCAREETDRTEDQYTKRVRAMQLMEIQCSNGRDKNSHFFSYFNCNFT